MRVQHAVPVQARHHHVEHDAVGPVGLDGAQPGEAVLGRADLVALELEHVLDQPAHRTGRRRSTRILGTSGSSLASARCIGAEPAPRHCSPRRVTRRAAPGCARRRRPIWATSPSTVSKRSVVAQPGGEGQPDPLAVEVARSKSRTNASTRRSRPAKVGLVPMLIAAGSSSPPRTSRPA